MAEPTKLTPLTPDEVRGRAIQFLTARKVAISGGTDLLTGTVTWSKGGGCARDIPITTTARWWGHRIANNTGADLPTRRSSQR